MKLLLHIDGFVRKFVPSQWLDRVGGYDVFVSYSQRDGIEYAESVTANARREGLTVFRDNDGIRNGEDIPDRIVRALNRAKLEWHSHFRMILGRRGICLAAGQPFPLKLLTQDD